MKSAKTSDGKDHAKIFGPAIVIILLGFFAAYQFVDPAPPKKITLSTGSEQGAYHFFGKRYKAALAKEGIELELVPSAGSLENIQRLQDAQVDLGFVQGGTRPVTMSEDALLTLASVYYEPLWIFIPIDTPITQLTELRGKRLAIGEDGSGTQAIARQLLEENLVTETETQFLRLKSGEMASELIGGRIDAGFIVASEHSETVKRLLAAPHIVVMTITLANAYTRRHPYLSSVVLPEGVISLDADIPSADVILLAPTANLVAQPEIHPAVIDLIMQAVDRVHRPATLFADEGTFPSEKYSEFTLSDESRRFFKSGPPFLQRYLPFWAATFIDRMLVMLLPFIALMVPLIRIMPPVFRWRIRARIYRWYRELLELDPLLNDKANIELSLAELDRIETEVSKIEVPMSYADQLYHLRVHLELIRTKLNNTGKTE